MKLGTWMRRGQRGFTLVELTIVVAVTGLLGGALTMAVTHLVTTNTHTTARMEAVVEVENVEQWISRDAYMAETVQVSGDADGLPLTLIWQAADGVEHQVVYSLSGSSLLREHYSDRASNPDPDVSTYVARNLDTDPAATNCAFANGVLTVTVTASVSNGAQSASETRTWQVLPRPLQ